MHVELDRFSYTVLMEFVKDDLKYSEIGGIYTSKGGWKLCGNDADLSELVKGVKVGDHMDFYIDNVVDNTIEPMKQMQPHVVMRPRPNLFGGILAPLFVRRNFLLYSHIFSICTIFLYIYDCLSTSLLPCLLFSCSQKS